MSFPPEQSIESKSQRGIDPSMGDSPSNPMKGFLLPKGEGKDEGQPRSMTQRRIFLFRTRTESLQSGERAGLRKYSGFQGKYHWMLDVRCWLLDGPGAMVLAILLLLSICHRATAQIARSYDKQIENKFSTGDAPQADENTLTPEQIKTL